LRTVRSGAAAGSIFNSGRTERTHCANPNPFTEPDMSISLNTTSAGTLVFCKIAMASSVWDAEAQVAILLSRYADETTDDGRKRLVRHGHLPEREIPIGIGPVGVRCPRVDFNLVP
jgi:hypothetical protein